MDVQEQKIAIRQQLLQTRKNIKDREQKDAAIRAQLIKCTDSIVQQEAKQNLFVYQSTKYEVDTKQIIEYYKDTLNIFVPVVQQQVMLCTLLNRAMQADQKYKTIDRSITVVPVVGFSIDKHRLGMGGGHYDRYLCECNTISIGIAYDEQFCEYLPVLQHDIPLNIIITPTKTIR